VTIAASPGQLLIEPDQQFILTNNGTKDRKFTYAHKSYVVEAGSHKVVPFDVIRLYFGDPRSVAGIEQRFEDPDGNANARIAKREKEIERLTVQYGLYAGNEDKLPSHPLIKDFVVETLDRIEIFCPAVDPDGQISYAHREATNTVQDTATLITQMQRKQEQQQALIDQLLGAQEQDPDDAELVPDRPRFPE
jgi:hypothetical protein